MVGWGSLRRWRLRRAYRRAYLSTPPRPGLVYNEKRLFQLTGLRLGGGSLKPAAYTPTKEHGTQRQETATTADSSFSTQPGVVLGDRYVLTLPPLVSSFTGRGSSTPVTARGVSGRTQPGSAV